MSQFSDLVFISLISITEEDRMQILRRTFTILEGRNMHANRVRDQWGKSNLWYYYCTTANDALVSFFHVRAVDVIERTKKKRK